MRYNRLKRRRVIIRKFNAENQSILLLYGIYKDTIDPEIAYSKFVDMYVSDDLLEIDFTCFYDGEERAGFSAAFFYNIKIKGKRTFIARSATGLMVKYQGKGLYDTSDLYLKFIRFALNHPFTQLWVCAFVINAIIFSDLCKFVPVVFPMPGKQVPAHIQQLMNTILASGGHVADEVNPLSVEVPIQVIFNEALLKRIFRSRDPNIQWYLKANPRFLDKFGLLMVIDVSASNIFGTLLNLIFHFSKRKRSRYVRTINSWRNSLKQKTATLVSVFTKRRIL